MQAPRHIQEALDREHPGVRLEWHPRLQWWVLTEAARWPDGQIARNAWLPRTGLLRGIEPWEWTHRRAVLYIGVIEEGIKHPLSLFAILDALRRFKKGTREKDAMESIDAIEGREETAESRRKRKERDNAMDRARDVWKSMHQSMFGRYHRRTDWTHTKAVNAEYDKRLEEQYGESGELADAEVTRRMQEGVGIAAARREHRAEVVT